MADEGQMWIDAVQEKKKKKKKEKGAFLTQKESSSAASLESQTDLWWVKYMAHGSGRLRGDLFLKSMPQILFSFFFVLKPAFMTLPRRLVTTGHCSSIFYSRLGRCAALEELDVNIFLFSAPTAKSLPTTNYGRGQFECCLGFFFFKTLFFTRLKRKTSFSLGSHGAPGLPAGATEEASQPLSLSALWALTKYLRRPIGVQFSHPERTPKRRLSKFE